MYYTARWAGTNPADDGFAFIERPSRATALLAFARMIWFGAGVPGSRSCVAYDTAGVEIDCPCNHNVPDFSHNRRNHDDDRVSMYTADPGVVASSHSCVRRWCVSRLPGQRRRRLLRRQRAARASSMTMTTLAREPGLSQKKPFLVNKNVDTASWPYRLIGTKFWPSFS